MVQLGTPAGLSTQLVHLLRSFTWLILPQTLTFALEDLCLHSAFVPALRQETENCHVLHDELPLLDAFLKESARLTSIDASERISYSEKIWI